MGVEKFYCQNPDCENRGKQFLADEIEEVKMPGYKVWLRYCKDCYKKLTISNEKEKKSNSTKARNGNGRNK